MEKKREIRYFGLIYLLVIGSASFWSYATNFYREVGLTSAQVGFINSACSLLSLLLLPVFGIISDRIRSPRKMLFLLSVLMIVPYIPLGLCGIWGQASFGLIFPLALISGTARSSTTTPMDAWAGAEISRLGVNFGNVRRYGSVGYIVASLLGSALIGVLFPNWSCFFFLLASTIPVLLIVGSRQGNEYENPAKKEERKESTGTLLRLVFRNYYFVTYLFLVIAFGLFTSIIGIDLSYLMDYVGAPRSSMGIVGSVRASTEIVVMVLLNRSKKLPPFWVLLVFSGILVAMENLLYASASSLLHICLITVFCSGISGGLYYSVANNYVFQVVDKRAGSTAMAVVGVARSLVSVLATGIGGGSIDRAGVTAMTSGIGVLEIVMTTLFLVACVIGRVVLKKPYVTERT